MSSLPNGDLQCWELCAQLELRPVCQHGHVHGFDQKQGGAVRAALAVVCAAAEAAFDDARRHRELPAQVHQPAQQLWPAHGAPQQLHVGESRHSRQRGGYRQHADTTHPRVDAERR